VPLYRVRDGKGDPDDRIHISGYGICRVGRPHLPRNITGVHDVQSGGTQFVDEAAFAQRGGCPVLTGMMRTGTGRNSDDRQLQCHHMILASLRNCPPSLSASSSRTCATLRLATVIGREQSVAVPHGNVDEARIR
jgi:hypothetical protein